jgi:hypothetical protein
MGLLSAATLMDGVSRGNNPMIDSGGTGTTAVTTAATTAGTSTAPAGGRAGGATIAR